VGTRLNPDVKSEYDSLGDEFTPIDEKWCPLKGELLIPDWENGRPASEIIERMRKVWKITISLTYQPKILFVIFLG
jgi:hypothetical protein